MVPFGNRAAFGAGGAATLENVPASDNGHGFAGRSVKGEGLGFSGNVYPVRPRRLRSRPREAVDPALQAFAKAERHSVEPRGAVRWRARVRRRGFTRLPDGG